MLIALCLSLGRFLNDGSQLYGENTGFHVSFRPSCCAKIPTSQTFLLFYSTPEPVRVHLNKRDISLTDRMILILELIEIRSAIYH